MSGSAERERAGRDEPHDPETSAAQVCGLLDLLGDAPKRVLELGCGGGRLLVPLVAAGHEVTGLDRDPGAIDAARTAAAPCEPAPRLIAADMLADDLPAGPFDAVLLLGNTLMTVWDVDEAVRLLERCAAVLAPGGVLVLDDIPGLFWPDVAEGNWMNGVDPDTGEEMLWSDRDAVFTLRASEKDRTPDGPDGPKGLAAREAAAVVDDVRYRLWTDGALRLLARAAGLSPPDPNPAVHLMILTRT